MQTEFDASLRAQVTRDDAGRVRHIQHLHYYQPAAGATVRAAAEAYVRDVAGVLEIGKDQLARLHQKVDFLAPREQPIEYRHYETKKFFAASTFAYYQTIHNTPVWDGGLNVTVKENPARVIGTDHRGHHDLAVNLPPQETIERVRRQLIAVNSAPRDLVAIAVRGDAAAPKVARISIRGVFPAGAAGTTRTIGTPARPRSAQPAWLGQTRLKRGLFYIYRYDAEDRQPGREGKEPPPVIGEGERVPSAEAIDILPTLPLPSVPNRIRDGRHYLVVELVFQVGRDARNWKALVEVETGAVLWLRPMTASVNGLVFKYDPKTSTGNLGNTTDSTNATLNPLRDDVLLNNLNGPVMGVQSLRGTNVTLIDDDLPTIAPPTKPANTDFDYDSRTNDFAAVNAYYHADNVFETIESLGFTLSGPGAYFDGTAFPVHVDHRASSEGPTPPGGIGIEINAFCEGDALIGPSDGIGLVGFCLSDDTGLADTTTNPLGRSVDKWVHWHEIGGHGILLDHVNSTNFRFAHSAGDALAAFQNDPESKLRTVNERFQYAPFRTWPAGIDRWFNRTPAAGWAWDGPTGNMGGYSTEQVIATTLFRVYQALGGDADEVSKRWHASRVATYLVLNAVGRLSPGTNPANAQDFFLALIAADGDDWTSEGLWGGAYGKVLRWSFEKQGLWRVGGTNMDPGSPPAVDLYIDDGRGGEYQYQAVHWANPSVWNRTDPDGQTGSQPGVAGVESHAYVKVKNRGLNDDTGTVKIYHSRPGAGLTWPTDFIQAGPAAGLPTGTVLANNGNEVIVGPFAWTPNTNAYGHDCLLAIVETTQDPSNIANFTPTQTIQEWRLVPHDNNIGQCNVQLIPGGGGMEALAQALDGVFFMAGNNFNTAAQMEITFELPRVLASRGWKLGFAGLDGTTFRLEAGEKRRIELRLSAGSDFTEKDVRGDPNRDLVVSLYGDGMLLGGMSYRLDPEMRKAPGRVPPQER